MKLSELKKVTGNRFPTEEQEQHLLWREQLQEMGMDPANMYQELEMESRFVDTHRDVSWSNDRVHLHSHTFYEVLYCRNTCGAEYLVGSVRYRLQRGDIVLVPPGVSHRPMLPEGMTEPYKRYVLWLSPEFVEIAFQLFPASEGKDRNDTNLIRTAGTPWEFLGERFRAGVQEAENALPGWEAAVLGNTLMLVTQIRRAMLDSRVQPLTAEKPQLLDRVMAYIEGNLGSRITLAEIAHHFYVSESTVSQLFRKKMGVSFYRCVTQRRLIAAKSLIESNIAMEDVSLQVGFQDYSSFYRAFKQEYGISPRQYRKMQMPAEEA